MSKEDPKIARPKELQQHPPKSSAANKLETAQANRVPSAPPNNKSQRPEAPVGVEQPDHIIPIKSVSTERQPKKRNQKKAPVIIATPSPVGELTSTGAPIWVKDSNGTEFPLYWSQIRIIPDPDAESLGYRVDGTVLVGVA